MTVHHFLAQVLIVLGAAVLVLLISARLRLAPVIGLLLTGVLIGPFGFGWIHELELVEIFAEIGVVFLLFSIGLEFTLERLRQIQRPFLLGGSVQAGTTILLITLVALFALDEPPRRALFFGLVIALSSTAVVLKLYHERREMESPQGKTVIGILLFQDFLIVPMIILTPVLAGTVEASAGEITLRLASGVLAVGAVAGAARFLMPRVLSHLVRTGTRELLVLGALFVCLGFAWFTDSFGFSLALGGFLAGIIISESHYSDQVAADMMPFRDLFTSVFFVSIGMLFDVSFALERLTLVLGVSAAVFAIKLGTGALATLALGFPTRILAIVSMSLAQIGEFSFVLLNVGRAQGLVGPEAYQTLIAVAVLTMLVTPAVVAVAPRIADGLPSWLGARGPSGAQLQPEIERAVRRDHMIVVGYGMTGRTLSRVLVEASLPHVVVELNGETVERGIADGAPILFGDSTRREILERAGIDHASAIVFAISDPEALRRSIRLARQLQPDLHIIVRTREHARIPAMHEHGANEVISQEFEAAIEIFTRVLRRYRVSRNIIRTQTRLLRGEAYRMLRAATLDTEATSEVAQALEAGTTDIFLLPGGSRAAGRTLRELDLRKITGATILAVVRDGQPIPSPEPNLALAVGDTLVLVGGHDQVDRAVRMLEQIEGADSDEGSA